MLEWAILPAVILGASLVPSKKKKDKDLIQEILRRKEVGIKINDNLTEYPKIINESHNVFYSTIIYSMPLGVNSEKFIEVLPTVEEAIRKNVDYEFERGVFKLYIYHENLPDHWDFTEDLLNPGKWLVPIGKNHKGIMYHDFDKYAHFLIGGVPGYGKTILTKVMFLSLILNNPQDVNIYILDLKGGLEYSKYLGLPQVKGVASDIFEATELLAEVANSMKLMEKTFKEKGYTNIVDTPIKQRTFIFVDEGAELSPSIVGKDRKKFADFCQVSLSEIARIGRAVGFRLIYSTQYPSSKSIDMSIKQNIVSRVSFVVASNVASRVILDETGAENLPSVPGRAIYLIDKKRTVQVPYISDQKIFELLEANANEIQRSGKSRKDITDSGQIGSNDNKASFWDS